MCLITIETPFGHEPIKRYITVESALVNIAHEYQESISYDTLKLFRVWYVGNVAFDYLARETCNYIHFRDSIKYHVSSLGREYRITRENLEFLAGITNEDAMIDIREYFDIVHALNNSDKRSIKGLYDKIFKDRRWYHSKVRLIKKLSKHKYDRIYKHFLQP